MHWAALLDTRRPVIKALVGLAFIAGAGAACHAAFSWIGYTPTDDGFTLAYSRRLLEGQIPHRDFIILRPFLSPALHVPWVAWAGDSLYWWSRAFVWVQWAGIAWLWTMTLNRVAGRPFHLADCVLLSGIGLVFTANVWAPMAWHTIDGLWLATLGAPLVFGRPSRPLRFLGYLLLGAAMLCKQSFLLAAPLALVIRGDARDARLWLAAALPGIVYLLYLSLTGALWDAALQFTAHGSLALVLSSNTQALTVLVLLGYLVFRLVRGTPPFPGLAGRTRATALGAVLGAAVLGLMVVWPAFGALEFYRTAYSLAALLLGGAIYFALEPPHGHPFLQVILMILVLAWSATVSIGARSPALMAGAMAVALLAGLLPAVCRPPWRTAVLLALALAAGAGFRSVRHRRVYMEQPADRLTCALDGVFPGGRRLRTNPNTYAFLEDLQAAVARARGYADPYAIVPDLPGYWARADQPNPLPIDWAKDTELPNDTLLRRVTDSLDSQRPRLTVIVQKVEAFPLPKGFIPLKNSDKFAVARHVRRTFKKCGETQYFELYR